MRAIIRTNAPIAPPATADAGMEDLLLGLTWPGGPVPGLAILFVGDGPGVGVLISGFLEMLEMSVGGGEDIAEGVSDEGAGDETGRGTDGV